MKTYRHLFDEALRPETIQKAVLDAADDKRDRRSVKRAISNMDGTIKAIQEQMLAMVDEDATLAEASRRRMGKTTPTTITDTSNGKQRDIEKPPFFPDQIIHHALMEPFKAVVMDGLYEQTYGCLPKKITVTKDGKRHVRKYGPHAAIKQLTKWAHCGKKLYVAELDVRHAYGTVCIPILQKKLHKKIRDKRWLELADQHLMLGKQQGDEEHPPTGLVLGLYPSPWFFNFYLKDFDHWAAAQGELHYLRFADNLFVFDTNKRRLHKIVERMEEYLWDELRLRLNASRQIYRFEYVDRRGRVRGRAINALGAVIHHDRVTMRKSILYRARKKAHKIKRKERATWYDGASMLARLSWFRHTRTHKYFEKYIKPQINIRNLKRKVARHSREIAAKKQQEGQVNDRLENGTGVAGGKAAGVGYDVERQHDLPAPERSPNPAAEPRRGACDPVGVRGTHHERCGNAACAAERGAGKAAE